MYPLYCIFPNIDQHKSYAAISQTRTIGICLFEGKKTTKNCVFLAKDEKQRSLKTHIQMRLVCKHNNFCTPPTPLLWPHLRSPGQTFCSFFLSKKPHIFPLSKKRKYKPNKISTHLNENKLPSSYNFLHPLGFQVLLFFRNC